MTDGTVREQIEAIRRSHDVRFSSTPKEIAFVDALTALVEGQDVSQVEFERDWFEDALTTIRDGKVRDGDYEAYAGRELAEGKRTR